MYLKTRTNLYKTHLKLIDTSLNFEINKKKIKNFTFLAFDILLIIVQTIKLVLILQEKDITWQKRQ